MQCLKCGKETTQQVFCEECLLKMKDCPIKPGTPVQLPDRREVAERRQIAKKPLSLKTKYARMKNWVKWLALALVCALAALAVVTALFLQQLRKPAPIAETEPDIGQNYNAVGFRMR